MMKTFEDVRDAARSRGGTSIVVAGAGGKAVLEAVLNAKSSGMMKPILVGDEKKINAVAEESGLDIGHIRIEQASEEDQAARRCMELIQAGEAHGVMKGKVSTPVLLKAVLDRKYGLRTERLLSHLAVLQVPGYHKLILVTDGGMVIRPDLEQKKAILLNGVSVLRRLGVERPKVAVLAAIETINPDMPETGHAEALCAMAVRGELGEVDVEGPIAVDVAFSPDAARAKGIESMITGEPDMVLVPDIASGNIFAKGLVYLAGAHIGGLVVGARIPIVLLSRADDAETKFNSLALCSVVGIS